MVNYWSFGWSMPSQNSLFCHLFGFMSYDVTMQLTAIVDCLMFFVCWLIMFVSRLNFAYKKCINKSLKNHASGHRSSKQI